MERLRNAVVYANDVTRYHHLFDASIEILGRLEYQGAASKIYTDMQGGMADPVQ